jgi:hypothetical protein
VHFEKGLTLEISQDKKITGAPKLALELAPALAQKCFLLNINAFWPKFIFSKHA